MDDLEDMMMMEAIRLSLASEEERRRKEDKDAKKKAKKEEKERKKEEKAARKNSLFTMNSNYSNVDGASSLMERSRSNLSSLPDEDDTSGKGKGIARPRTPPFDGGSRIEEETPRGVYIPDLSLSGTSQESLAPSIPIPTAAEPFRRSHLRQMSTASSASSSIVEPPGSFPGSSTPPAGILEPMFNFQSLAAMIGQDEKGEKASHVENADGDAVAESWRDMGSQASDESPLGINGDTETAPSGADGTGHHQPEKAPVKAESSIERESSRA